MSDESKKKISEKNKGRHPYNFGKKLSEDHKKKIGLANSISQKGLKQSEETKLKRSDTLKNFYQSNQHWSKGTHHEVSKETARKIGLANIGRKLTPEHRKKLSIIKIQNPNRVFKDTSIELKVEQELISRRLNYQKQVPLCKTAIVDFYLPEYRIVIQCDGCYWHNCPIHGHGEIKHCSEKDERQDKVLTFNGFNVYRFWEHEINSSVEGCLDKIEWDVQAS